MVSSQLAHHHFWYGKDANSAIDVICLLPNGICVSFPSLRADTPLNKIKTNLWIEAKRFSMSQKLKAHTEYVFVVVSKDGGTEEVMDEELSLFDIKPVRPFLKATQRQGDAQVKQLNSKISMLIGKAVTTSKDEQVVDLRKKCLEFCNRISLQRGRASWERRAIYTFPPDFEEDHELPAALANQIERSDNLLKITVYYTAENVRIFNVFIVSHKLKPRDLVQKVLNKRYSIHGKKNNYSENAEDFVLKEFGKENFFLGFVRQEENQQEVYMEKPLIQYKYVRECLLWDREIKLLLKEKHELDVGMLEAVHIETPPPLPVRESRYLNEICLWSLGPATLLRIKIQCALSIMADADMWKEVHCGIFHGGEEVCETRVTSRQKGIHPCWNEFLEFQLPVAELPRMAKVCLCIVGYASRDSRKKNPIPIAWANIPIFNYKGMLNTGTMKLNCKQHTRQSRQTLHIFFNPLGAVSSIHDSKGPCIVIEFMKFVHAVAYPMDHQIYEIALRNPRRHTPVVLYRNQPWEYFRPIVEEIIQRDTLASMFEEDKEILWTWREMCCEHFPYSLPKLLQCVKWHVHEDVAEIHYLLKEWQHERLDVEIALELLDYKFPDIDVRTLAVKVLKDSISDNELEMYFLHLVQALKYESYLDSPLAKYLLQRALNNRRIGHYLFWHLKAEVGNPDYALQFGLILEMYCRGAVQHIDNLTRQVEAINKMKTVTEILKSYKETDGQKKLKMMRECFEGPAYVKAFTNLVSPLDPRSRLKRLKVEKCKYMESKKKPLWLVFENYDEDADDVLIIFKNGDDLRQDMLTLLSLRLMSNVWNNAGLDYGIIPYRVLSTGPMVGLIEVVPDSETLGRIQYSANGLYGTFKENGLYGWLGEYCKKNESRNTDIETYIHNFTSSVIGYSVAMYVLGVGDRHNDNIMMKKDTGQLFHIDFGHFLGNVKKKLGYNREKAKLILTKDIIYCIKKSDKENSFNVFKETCTEAFSCLRRRGNLFITIFAMLLSTGIPELNHPNDLEYLRTSLAMSKDEQEAANHFGEVFDEAIKNNFNTSINFWMHNIKHYWID